MRENRCHFVDSIQTYLRLLIQWIIEYFVIIPIGKATPVNMVNIGDFSSN